MLAVSILNVNVGTRRSILHSSFFPSATMSPSLSSSRPLTTLLESLAKSPWTLTRTLRSDNPHDFNGQLRGTATFTPLPDAPENPAHQDWLYSEEGEMPSQLSGAGTVGLRWTKKYIWRVSSDSDADRIGVWFVKVAPGPEQADYLFHNFETADATRPAETGDSDHVALPTPPPVAGPSDDWTVLAARGCHLCIKDMYRTAYAFRIRPDSGEVLSWASRHVVHGPKKDQDIVNQYERAS